MINHAAFLISLIVLISTANVLSQCINCAPQQGCCMGHMHGQWYCCGGHMFYSMVRQITPWNFKLQIKYDVYVWDCTPSNTDLTQQYTNVTCLLDGRWSLDHLTFQLNAIPSNELKTIVGKYTMKDGQSEKVALQADSHWALTVPVDQNKGPQLYDKLEFSYDGFNYTYHFGYGPYPHCPRC